MNRDWSVEVFEAATSDGAKVLGERYLGHLPVAEISSSHIVRGACEMCWRYGRNFACPPHSLFFPEWVAGSANAEVIYLRFPAEAFEAETPQARTKACSREAQRVLYLELLSSQKAGLKVAGAGPCRACEVCALERGGEECHAPDKRIYSLESMGVNVVELVRDVFGIELEWEGEDGSMIGAVGCVFEVDQVEREG